MKSTISVNTLWLFTRSEDSYYRDHSAWLFEPHVSGDCVFVADGAVMLKIDKTAIIDMPTGDESFDVVKEESAARASALVLPWMESAATALPPATDWTVPIKIGESHFSPAYIDHIQTYLPGPIRWMLAEADRVVFRFKGGEGALAGVNISDIQIEGGTDWRAKTHFRRIPGSPALESAVDYFFDRLKAEQFIAVAGYGTEIFDRMCKAKAYLDGVTAKQVEKDHS